MPLTSGDESISSLGKLYRWSKDVLVITDFDYHVLEFNPMLTRKLGYHQHELERMNLKAIIHPDDLQRSMDQLTGLVAGAVESIHFENRLLAKNGNIYWWEWDTIADYETQKTYAVGRDITELKAQEAFNLKAQATILHLTAQSSLKTESFLGFLHRYLNQLKDIFQVDSASYWLFKEESTEIHCLGAAQNPDEANRTGLCIREVEAPNYFHGIRHQQLVVARDASSHPSTKGLEENYLTTYGVRSMMDAQVFVKNYCSGILCLESSRLRDWSITEQNLLLTFCSLLSHVISIDLNRRLEDAQAEIHHQLEVKNEELEQFVYIASHDLKEPLNNTRTLAGLLQSQLDHPDNLKLVDFILQSADRMSLLITDLLNYGLIGKDLEKREINTNEILRDILEILATQIQETQAHITLDQLPIITGFPSQIQLLFQNLILNGLKYQPQGQAAKILVTCENMDDNWHFLIRDNGIGIDARNHEKIFELFKRLHSKKQYVGTGIGLAHCKKIVELHKGKIWVESSLGQGSTFHVSLPKN